MDLDALGEQLLARKQQLKEKGVPETREEVMVGRAPKKRAAPRKTAARRTPKVKAAG